MTVKIEVFGSTAADALIELRRFAEGLFPSNPNTGGSHDAAAGNAGPTETQGALVTTQPPEGQEFTQSSTEAVAPAKPRGRPRTKSAQKDAQPEVAQAQLPAAEQAEPAAKPETVVPEVATAAAALTHDAVKAALQNVMHAAKDQNAGMADAFAIVKKYGYTHVRDIKPEHFAAIHADAVAKLAGTAT